MSIGITTIDSTTPIRMASSILKETTSVCSHCLEPVAAEVVERDGTVVLQKRCAVHGDEEALLASDSRLYWNLTTEKTNPAAAALACGAGCCGTNHSCTLIFEITERCNLTCPTCFTASSPHLTWSMPFDEFSAKLKNLRGNGKSDADIVQISGGEPTVHPEFERIVAHCFEQGVGKVYVNTNGVRLATEPDLAHRLAAIDGGKDRLQFYLQFDGFAESTYAQIRGSRNLFPVKQRAIANLLGAGLFVLPVMTVTRGINLDEIGDVIRFVRAQHPKMNTVMLQPAFYAGRYENAQEPQRLTLAELAHEVVEQTNGLFSLDDFSPIPCSHPNCFALAVALVRGDQFVPLSRYFPRFESWTDAAVEPFVSRFTDQLPATMLESIAEDDTLDLILDMLGQGDDAANWRSYRDFFVVGIKPFMDAHTYDQQRVDRCCVHVVDRAGEPVSLCEYNVRRRPAGLL